MLTEFQKIKLECKSRELRNFEIGSVGYTKKFIELQELELDEMKIAVENKEKGLNKYKQEVETWKSL